MTARTFARTVLASLALVAASGAFAVGAPAASASSSSDSTTVKLSYWFDHFGDRSFGALDGDYANAESETDVGGKLARVCMQMATDVTAAQAHPIPVTNIQVHWATALEDAANASLDCIYGLGVSNKAKSQVALGTANVQLAAFESQSTIAFNMLGKYL